MRRLAAFALILVCSATAQAHHWVRDVYDSRQRSIVEVEVKKFQLVHPHPLMLVEIVDVHNDGGDGELEAGQTWTLEMDNKRELEALGFDGETFVPGDKLTVAVDPSRNSLYRKNTLYLRAIEHRRGGFIYLHNVRRLHPIESDDDHLTRHLHEVN